MSIALVIYVAIVLAIAVAFWAIHAWQDRRKALPPYRPLSREEWARGRAPHPPVEPDAWGDVGEDGLP
jgi:hypothetical protein